MLVRRGCSPVSVGPVSPSFICFGRRKATGEGHKYLVGEKAKNPSEIAVLRDLAVRCGRRAAAKSKSPPVLGRLRCGRLPLTLNPKP